MGITHLDDHDTGGVPLALLSLYRDDGTRLLRVGGPPDALPQMARVLRAAGEGAPRGLPCCETCGCDLGAPDIDRITWEDECAST